LAHIILRCLDRRAAWLLFAGMRVAASELAEELEKIGKK
jgi:hypothetical protein